MTFDASKLMRKRGDIIQSEDWNQLVAEVAELRKYVDNMTHTVTLTGLNSPVGKAYGLSSGVPDDFNYAADVIGLIDKQYYTGKADTGDICRFGIMDYAETMSYWSGAANGNRNALEIEIKYYDDQVKTSDKLFIHEWSKLQIPGDNNNPHKRYWMAPNGRVWYQYELVNPRPDIPIRYLTFRDQEKETAIRIGNVLHYTKRLRPLGHER